MISLRNFTPSARDISAQRFMLDEEGVRFQPGYVAPVGGAGAKLGPLSINRKCPAVRRRTPASVAPCSVSRSDSCRSFGGSTPDQ